jgi:hypothetical protein
MDFKVAGTRAGLTAVQLDMKVPGLSPRLLAEALQPARAAREQLMTMMEAAVSEHEAPADDVAVFGSAEINKELLVGGGRGLGRRDAGHAGMYAAMHWTCYTAAETWAAHCWATASIAGLQPVLL